jgi:MOSC domain-containing protein YiiM
MNRVIGKIVAVNISETKGVVKKPIEIGVFKVDHGLVGDAHAGNWHRQVSLLDEHSIDKVGDLSGVGFCTGKFAENLTTEGIVLYELPIGTKLKIGTTIQEVTQIGKDCHVGCEIRALVGDCVMPREGIFTKILQNGEVKAGDKIEIIEFL